MIKTNLLVVNTLNSSMKLKDLYARKGKRAVKSLKKYPKYPKPKQPNTKLSLIIDTWKSIYVIFVKLIWTELCECTLHSLGRLIIEIFYSLEVNGNICICKKSDECKCSRDKFIIQDGTSAFESSLHSKFYFSIYFLTELQFYYFGTISSYLLLH